MRWTAPAARAGLGVGVPDPFYAIRPGREGDHAFVVESWQIAHAQTRLGREQGPHYVSEQKGLIRDILSRPTTELRVACVLEDIDAILGYAVVGLVCDPEPRAYYAYTKAEARRLGIARALLADLLDKPVCYTHRPQSTLADAIPRPPLWYFSYFKNWEPT